MPRLIPGKQEASISVVTRWHSVAQGHALRHAALAFADAPKLLGPGGELRPTLLTTHVRHRTVRYSDDLIGQAKAMLMGRSDMDVQTWTDRHGRTAAFAVLTRVSQNSKRKLHDGAREPFAKARLQKLKQPL